MKLLNFFQYVYLVFAIFFIYKGFDELGVEGGKSIFYFLFAVLAIFMFFFRRRFRKKFENRKDS